MNYFRTSSIVLLGLPELVAPLTEAQCQIIGSGSPDVTVAEALANEAAAAGRDYVVLAGGVTPETYSWLESQIKQGKMVFILRSNKLPFLSPPKGSRCISLPTKINKLKRIVGMPAYEGAIGRSWIELNGSVEPPPALRIDHLPVDLLFGGIILGLLGAIAPHIPFIRSKALGKFSLDQVHRLCTSSLGQISQDLFSSISIDCNKVGLMVTLSWIAIVAGIILAVIGLFWMTRKLMTA